MAILELMGHAKSAGFVKTVELAGHGMLRVDVPAENNGDVDRTEYYSPGALYSLKPVTEEFAKLTARQIGRPVTQYGLESVFGSMSIAELEKFQTRVTRLIESRQLVPAPSVVEDPGAMPEREDWDDDDE